MRVVMGWMMQGQLGLTRHKVWIPTHYFFSIVFFFTIDPLEDMRIQKKE